MKDWLGNEYDVGDKIVYAAMSGRSVTMVLGEVVKFNESGSVTVKPLNSSRWQQHYGHDYYVDTRTNERISPYGSGMFANPDIWAKLGGYYDDQGNRVADDGYTYHYELVSRGYHYESGELQPYIEQRNDGPKAVTLTVTKNITRWFGEVE